MPESGAPARLHLDDDEFARLAGHDVDLALPAAPVAIENHEAERDEMIVRGLLTGTPEVVLDRHETTLSASGIAARHIRAICGRTGGLTGPAPPGSQLSRESSSGSRKSRRVSSSTLTSLKVSTRTDLTKRSAR